MLYMLSNHVVLHTLKISKLRRRQSYILISQHRHSIHKGFFFETLVRAFSDLAYATTDLGCSSPGAQHRFVSVLSPIRSLRKLKPAHGI